MRGCSQARKQPLDSGLQIVTERDRLHCHSLSRALIEHERLPVSTIFSFKRHFAMCSSAYLCQALQKEAARGRLKLTLGVAVPVPLTKERERPGDEVIWQLDARAPLIII